ncbi:MAG: hypothetical protein KTR29_24105, partial [Rhodothermaceae bacterium]|nr:hypothetical protein [Rhodothermaceae bacterium]
MGNSALLVVVASIISAVTIFLNIRNINIETNLVQNQLQEEVLARELAHNGLNVMLANVYGSGVDGGFDQADAFRTYNVGGGKITTGNYTEDGEFLKFDVLGEYGEAQYLIHTEYKYSAHFPFAFAANTPNLTLITDEESSIKAGTLDPDLAVNWITSELQTLDDLPGMQDLINEDQVETKINTALDEAFEGGVDEVQSVNVLERDDTFSDALPDFDPSQDGPWLEEFYYEIRDKINPLGENSADLEFLAPLDADETTFAAEFGSQIPESEDFLKNYVVGEADNTAIVRVDGNMVVRDGSTLAGAGILLVEGDLIVEPNATLNWDGIVYLRPETSHSVTKLSGTVDINGALVASQEALPLGSHMDVTTNRDLSGTWSIAEGRDTYQGGKHTTGPWFVHVHKWDQQWGSRLPISTSREIFFRDAGGRTIHEDAVRFDETIRTLIASGIPEVKLRFLNTHRSGMGRFIMELSDGQAYDNSIAAGFNGDHEITFAPSQLVKFDMQFRSVRFLELMRDPDPEKSGMDGAVRVARDRARRGAFHLQLIDPNAPGGERLLMTTSVYQHIREDESDEYEEELDELRDDIANGNFGLTIDMG